jgi:VanZ family protein
MKAFLMRWGPALLVMAAIFAASSQPKAVLPDYGERDWLVKKSGHLLIYGVLAWSYLRGLGWLRPSSWRTAALAVVLAALYGATDELHQSFVAGRGAALLDVGIDTVGASLGLALTTAWSHWRAGSVRRQPRGA